MKKKLKVGFKDRSPREKIIDGVKFYVKPMSQEVMIGMALYSQGSKGSITSEEGKKEFIKSHLTGWDDLYDEDGEAVKYSQQLAVEYLTDDDYDDLFMLLYWTAIEFADDDAKDKQENKEQIKK